MHLYRAGKTQKSDALETTPCLKTMPITYAAPMLDTHGKELAVKGSLDSCAVVNVMPVSTWTDMRFDRLDLVLTNIRCSPVSCCKPRGNS